MTARANGSSGLDYADRCEAEAAVAEDWGGLDFLARRMRVEQLALANMKSTNLNPMEEWDRAVADWMAKDNCSRDAAIDRIWGRTTWGSALWQRACTWHASQPQIAIENGCAASHHIWLLNSIVSGFDQSGIQTGGSDYDYFIHNTVFDNSRSISATCNAQGSGISIFQASEIPGYTPTADDQNNPVLGSWQAGSSFFHVVVEYNVAYNNAITTCGTVSNAWDTDGNGIIFDTNAGFAGNPTNYTAPMLAAFNIVYNNGGGGMHVFGSSSVTVANNSCYNNYLDPANGGTFRACIDDNGGSGNNYINNIAVGIPTATSGCSISPPFTRWNNAILDANQSGQAVDTFSNNLTDTIGIGCQDEVAMNGSSTYNAPPNIESTNPMWVNVGTSSVGTETTPPAGANFALSPGSPAIGKGLTEPYLPSSSVDLGACASSLTTCP